MIAPLPDRIVQRSILDVLHSADELVGVQEVLAVRTSVGGMRGKGVEQAIELIEEAITRDGYLWAAGSDISGFFRHIRPREVRDFLADQTEDAEFLNLFERAMTVELANEDSLAPDIRALFPTDEEGVAQGCPLSAFAGNVVLKKFDQEFNQRSILCIRYIDDFMLLGKSRSAVEKAFESACRFLKNLNMSAYSPGDGTGKAFFGRTDEGHEFLGYRIIPGVFPPAERRVVDLMKRVDVLVAKGKQDIGRALKGACKQKLQAFVQTLDELDKLIRSWSGAFQANRCKETAARIDQYVSKKIAELISFYSSKSKGLVPLEQQRLLGVRLVSDDIMLRVS